ncbi:hypothetical protein ACQW02_04725 [Humitalea sp. 24SJ18S-53]|uniref:hypothetical protein n=1 Tax=Humitalea sp. 24SJ18S-53 TaxID=3422307 RepID=UPI003D66CD3D
MRIALLLLPLSLLACAELRTPVPMASLPPLSLIPNVGDPARAAVTAAAEAWSNQRRFEGNPAAAARAAALLEWLAADVPRSPRWAALPRQLGFDLANARAELRQALSIQADAPPGEVIGPLTTAANAGTDAAARARALQAAPFAQGPDGTAVLLGRMGSLALPPTVTANLRQAVQVLDQTGGWDPNPVRLEDTVRAGETTTGGLGTFY